ncbi:response regulator [Paenibacillus sp. GCM10023248]|uniref:response regulator transcription factor n=1 Tax=unclassified Paenibacillus TaxID=185978 RepID=UPI00237860CF|nr:response regulator transcription factor [Paenibacillus sp. MAHUQ-63]MDD9266137.1 response regulator transcription factor [Paenibacillus sp. MAHUQ-63]
MWKIAIIDDERQVLQGMKRAIPWDELEAEWVGEALNGQEGLELIRRAAPDIVITDIYMPVMSGLDMIEQLRREGFGGKIIILSGYSDFEHARQALRHNVSDYLSKPISVPTLKSILGKAIEELMDEEEKRIKQDELQQKLMLYEPFIEKEWVKSAVAGTLDRSYRSEDRLPQPYRFWCGRKHVVVGIELIRDVRSSRLSLPDWNLFRFAISNIACEVARESFQAIEYVELHGTRAVLILHPEADCRQEDLDRSLGELGVKLIDCIKNYLKLVIRIGIGGTKAEWTAMPDSTEEAFRAIDLRDRRVEPAYEVFAYSEETGAGQGTLVMRPAKFYFELAGAMKASQETQAQQLVAGYMKQLKEQKGITPEYVQMLAGELWGIFAYCLYEVGMVLDDIFSNEQIVQEMVGLTQPQQLEEWLTAKISVIFSSRQWKGNSKHRQAVDFMTQYIHEHYAEDMTLADLADKVYISRNHLSIIFKNMTGETFNTYLTRVRIEKARELLLERNMLVYEVAEQVGYKNVPYFSTLFKKFTGMNPTELIK